MTKPGKPQVSVDDAEFGHSVVETPIGETPIVVTPSVVTADEPELLALGRALGRCCRPGHRVFMTGAMGTGKTTLTRAMAEGLGVERPDRVRSPTFNLCIVHRGPLPLVHLDLYRLGEAQPTAAFEALGFEALLDRVADAEADIDADKSVIAVEWAELWPGHRVEGLHLTLCRPHGRDDVRTIEAEAIGRAHVELLAAWKKAGNFGSPPPKE